MIKDNVLFLKECINQFQETGAVCASSPKAAKALSAPLREKRTPMKILELGPGTGSVTVQILKDMIEGDELHICEINPNFMKALQKKLLSNTNYQKHKKNITFKLCAAQELSEEIKFDVIIGCLPFLNFDFQTVKDIFDKIYALSHKDTVMTYFEYIGIRKTGKMMLPRIKAIHDFLSNIYAKHRVSSEQILLNIFPMTVHTLKTGTIVDQKLPKKAS